MLETFNDLLLPEFKILSKKEESGVIFYNVIPIKEPEECTFCHSKDVVQNGSIERLVRDIPSHDKQVALIIMSHRYKCKACNHTFSASFEMVDDRSKITNRFKDNIKNYCLKTTVSALSAETGLSVATISRIIKEYIAEQEAAWEFYTPKALGLSEIMIGKAKRTLCIDVENKGVIDLIEKSDKMFVEKYLKSLDLNKIDVFLIDFNENFRNAITMAKPDAVILVDKFYVIRDVVGAVSKDLTKLGHHDINALFIKNSSKLTEEEQTLLNSNLANSSKIQKLYDIKEKLIGLYDFDNRNEAKRQFDSVRSLIGKDYPETAKLYEKLLDYQEEILSFIGSKYSSSGMQLASRAAAKIEKQGAGYSFENLKARLLFGYSKKTAKTVVRKPVYKPSDYSKHNYTSFGGFNSSDTYKEESIRLGNYISLESIINIKNSSTIQRKQTTLVD